MKTSTFKENTSESMPLNSADDSVPPDTALLADEDTTVSAITKIRELHGKILKQTRTTLNDAIAIGELLTLLKGDAGHGNWGKFLKQNLPFSERTAQNYMNLSKSRDQFKSANLADLLLSKAYDLVNNRKKPAETTCTDSDSILDGDTQNSEPVRRQEVIREINRTLSGTLRRLASGPIRGLEEFKEAFEEFLTLWKAQKTAEHEAQ